MSERTRTAKKSTKTFSRRRQCVSDFRQRQRNKNERDFKRQLIIAVEFSVSKTPSKRTQQCWPINSQHCWVLLHVASACTYCLAMMLLGVVASSLKPVKLLAPCKRTQHCLPTTPSNRDFTIYHAVVNENAS